MEGTHRAHRVHPPLHWGCASEAALMKEIAEYHNFTSLGKQKSPQSELRELQCEGFFSFFSETDQAELFHVPEAQQKWAWGGGRI